MKDNTTETLFSVSNIFAGILALGAVATPFLASFTQIREIFIDEKYLVFIAVLAFLVSIMMLWIGLSKTTFLSLWNFSFNAFAGRKILILVFFAASFLFIYFIKIIYNPAAPTLFERSFALMSQAILFIIGSGLFALFVGVNITDTVQQIGYDKRKQEEVNRIIKLMLNYNLASLNVTIKSVFTGNDGYLYVTYDNKDDNNTYLLKIDNNIETINTNVNAATVSQPQNTNITPITADPSTPPPSMQ